MASHPNRAMVMKNDVSNISVLCMTYMCAPFFPSWNQLVWFNVFNVVMVNHFLKAKKLPAENLPTAGCANRLK